MVFIEAELFNKMTSLPDKERLYCCSLSLSCEVPGELTCGLPTL